MKIFKKNKYKLLSTLAKYSFIVVIVFSVMMPFVFVKAECGGVNQPKCDVSCGGPNQPPTCPPLSNTSVNVSTKINNPLAGYNDIPSFIEAIINVVLVVGVPIVTLAIIYCGFLFVKARGNPEELTKAKKTLMYTLIGAALLLGSFVIAKAIKGTVDEIKSTT
jgi:hypothetical protein